MPTYSGSKNYWPTYMFDLFQAMLNFETDLSSDSDSPGKSLSDAFRIRILPMKKDKKPPKTQNLRFSSAQKLC
jgi:hypothetical protein